MVPSFEAIGLMLTLVLVAILLFGILVFKIKNKDYYRVLISAILCSFIAFVIFSLGSSRFSLIASLLFGFMLGFIAGALWSAIVLMTANIIPLKIYKWLPDKAEIWFFGILPSCVYLGFVTAKQNISFWWFKLLLVLFIGISIAVLCKLMGLNIRNKKYVVTQKPIRIQHSPIIWVPIIILFVSLSINMFLV